ncbi:hypothetical protein C3747_281g28 [Trypanosoma cruzi]|uniref:Reverse transcriptase domain-containing protein n=1 Tax=Trypanosoma cruzi TaxID=5693 RepID=A0A2V2VCE9_TRYCR|nr:hypothetical protein C3747_281g22 [Trypanosoma cruzi]PWU94185.1 hypothetical protein C3747_281g28 [Trypanosoma cruzi]
MERTPAARIRNVIESQSTLQPSGFLPGNSTPDQLLHLRAAMHRNAPQHRTAAVFVKHANAFGTVGPDAVILEMRRLSIPNRIARWSAACLNSTSAVVCIDKLTPSSRTLTRGAPQGTAPSPIIFVVVMQSRCPFPSNVPYFAEDSLLTPSPPSHSRATGIRSTRPQKIGLSAVAEWTREYFMEATPGRARYTLLGAGKTAPLRLAYEDARVTMERTPTLLDVKFQHPRGMGTRCESP